MVDLDTYPEDEPGFDWDDAAILCCLLMIASGLLAIANTFRMIIFGG